MIKWTDFLKLAVVCSVVAVPVTAMFMKNVALGVLSLGAGIVVFMDTIIEYIEKED